MEKINLLDFNRRKMREFFERIGEASFRADQVMRWIYHYHCDNFDLMTNINKALRSKLKKIAEICAPKIEKEHHSFDGTIKWLVSVGDQSVEMVYIPTKKDRSTLCISSQAGCALGCKFCSTGQNGFNRNLRISEIIGQVWRAKKIINTEKSNGMCSITNIVMMGMGEPLLNLKNVIAAIEIMLDDFGFGFSRHRITISTAGIAPGIDKLNNIDKIDVALAVSLHAPNDKIRDKIMPINKKYNIATLLSSIQRYLGRSASNRNNITIEYVMLNSVNDDVCHARQLAYLLKDVPCKINLIPWNSFYGAKYSCSSERRINHFSNELKKFGFLTTVRKPRGKDINAACGQLTGNITRCTR